MVAITGNVPGALIGKDAFQEIDINGITLPMTKHNYLVRDADDIPRVIAEAFHIARTGRPGPVHVDITKDALTSETQARAPRHPRPARLQAAASRAIPPGHAGGARDRPRPGGRSSWPATASCIANATDELRAFAEKTQIPVAHTLLGVGAIDERHPLSYGYMGMHGWKHVNKAIQSSDLLIALGMRFDDRVTGNGQHVRAARPHHPRRHRPVRDRQERRRRRAHRRRRRARPARAHRCRARAVDPAERADYFAELAAWRATPRPRPGTARAVGARASSPPTTSSAGSAS